MTYRFHTAFISAVPVGRQPGLPTRRICRLPQRARTSRRVHYPTCIAETLDEAFTKGFVQDCGRYVQLDQDGNLPSSSELRSAAELRSELEDAIQALLGAAGQSNVVSVFVRGSVASGLRLQNGNSDLDLIVVTDREMPKSQRRDTVCHAVSDVAKGSLGFSGADLRFVSKNDPLLRPGPASANFRNLLRNHSVLLYGSEAPADAVYPAEKPGDGLALDIRSDEVSFLRLFRKGEREDEFGVQLSAIQWICKRALRAVSDLASEHTGQHSRDLVPCYRLSAQAFPQYSDVMLEGLQFACASDMSGYLELERSGFLERGYNVARNLVEVAEELCLQRRFDEAADVGEEDLTIVPREALGTDAGLQTTMKEIGERSIATLKWQMSPQLHNIDKMKFVETELPELGIEPQSMVEEVEWADAEYSAVLRKVSEPMIFRGALRDKTSMDEDASSAIIRSLLCETLSVQCRVSPSSTFTFCRGTHPWIADGTFTPLSKLVTLPTAEAVTRLCEDHGLPAVHYGESEHEHIYIQTAARGDQQVFRDERTRALRVAQGERVWVSAGGSVSGLHYDAAFSALAQRAGAKRMVFLPPACLARMGVYPLGHPLHRRVRVDVGRRDTRVFKDFWEDGGMKASVAHVMPGDVVVFPPLWAHYTQSWADDGGVCVSNTFRFL